MKKILITTLAFITILTPISVFAAAAALDDSIAGPPKQGTINQFNAPVDTGTADSLVQQASVLGCSSTGGNGGSLSNSLGGALRGVGSNALQSLFGGGGFNSAADGGGGGGGGGFDTGGFGNDNTLYADTGYASPGNILSPNQFTGATNGFSLDNVFATDSVSGHQQAFGGFSVAVPTGSNVDGVEVNVRAKSSAASGCQVGVSVSWDGGTTWSSPQNVSITNTDTNYTFGGATDTWGHTWTAAQTGGGKFAVRVQNVDPGAVCADGSLLSVDSVQARIDYSSQSAIANSNTSSGQSSGGGGGGGGLSGLTSGPLGGIISQVKGLATGQLSSLAQQGVNSLLGNSSITSAASSLITGGIGAGAGIGALGLAAGIPGVPGVGAFVPVDVKANVDTPHFEATDKQTKVIENKITSVEYKYCFANPQFNKYKNTLEAEITKNTIKAISETSTILNYLKLFATDDQAVFKDNIDNNLSGMCSTIEPDVKAALLTDYQYSQNIGQQVQCTSDSAGSSGGEQSELDIFASCFTNPANCAPGAYLVAKGGIEEQRLAQYQSDSLAIVAGNGQKGQIKCTSSGDAPPGMYCEHNSSEFSTPGHVMAIQLSNAFDRGNQQLVAANEAGEMIDSLTASLTQMAFQSLDGLLGLTKRNSNTSQNNASYLDTLVAEDVDGSIGDAQAALGADIQGSIDTEETYRDTMEEIIDNLNDTKDKYDRATACYKKLTTSISTTITGANAQQRMTDIGSIVGQVITPQLTNLNQQVTKSEGAIDQLNTLYSELQSALTLDDITQITASYVMLTASGTIHNSTDIILLENDLKAGAIALLTLNRDATDKLNECQGF